MSFVRNRYRDGYARDFEGTLRELKRHGCVLLITGAVVEDVTLQATRRLAGDPRCDRKRVLVATRRSDMDIADGLPPGVERNGPDVRVIRPTNVELNDSPTDVGQTELQYIRTELLKAVGYFDDIASGLSPAELRVSIDSLEGLLETNGYGTVTRFLRTVMALVRGVSGIGHVHLPVPDDSRTVARLSPLFDARIELRRRDRLVAEQRWHVPMDDRSTGWVKL
ncbi:hypothetical protein [Haladaptatus sp. CMAA 1909]|uniref:DUF7504 family protein n=1 Tax=Haladaptatus sp. CMAA 1909 TaxID=3368986 RepID=UPI00375440F0